VRWDLIVKAVEAHTSHETRWVVLYVKRFVNMNVEAER